MKRIAFATTLTACVLSAVVHGIASAASLTDPYPSTYRAPANPPTLIRSATILDGAGARLENTDLLIVDGKIKTLGKALPNEAGARVIDAKGRWVTPGLIDVHSHIGVFPTPQTVGNEDGNETTTPATANVWVEHGVWPQDPAFATALAGGITSLQILPGSGNLIGGRSVVLKNVPAVTYQAMKFPDSRQGLKMACGENPKRNYGARQQFPRTRMGNVAGFRAQWTEGQEYLRDWKRYEDSLRKGGKAAEDAKPPKRDLRLETLAGALRGDILVHVHCYRSDEMAVMLDLAREFGFQIASFEHATEAYKITKMLAEHKVCAAMWADWWGAKMEVYDGIPENIAMVDAARDGCAILHSDDPNDIQRLNQEAGKAMARGRAAGFDIAPERAIRWLTANPAKSLGILEKTGTLEPGKMADVVVWNRNPFSVYARADQVFIDGSLEYDRADPGTKPRSDFMLGQPAITKGGRK